MKELLSYTNSPAALSAQFPVVSEIILNIWNSKYVQLQPLFWQNSNLFKSMLESMNYRTTLATILGILMEMGE